MVIFSGFEQVIYIYLLSKINYFVYEKATLLIKKKSVYNAILPEFFVRCAPKKVSAFSTDFYNKSCDTVQIRFTHI